MSRKLERQLLPPDLVEVAPEAVQAAQKRAEDAIEESKRAVGAAHKAQQEADEAPAKDDAAALDSYRADKNATLPKPKAPALAAKAENAARVARLAQQEAAHAVDALHAVREEHHDPLVAVLEKQLAEERQRAHRAGGEAEQVYGELSRTASRLARLHDRAEELDRGGRVRGSGDLKHAFSTLRQAAEDLARHATPATTRVLAAVGDGPTRWEDVAAKEGVEQNDEELCAARNYLLNKRRLEWLDADEVPLRERDPQSLRVGVFLVPSTPPPTPKERALRLRAERQAA